MTTLNEVQIEICADQGKHAASSLPCLLNLYAVGDSGLSDEGRRDAVLCVLAAYLDETACALEGIYAFRKRHHSVAVSPLPAVIRAHRELLASLASLAASQHG